MEDLFELVFELVGDRGPKEVQKAVDAGAEINARDKDGDTPLIEAAKYNKNPEVIKVLLDAGAEINVRNIKGNTPLVIAAAYNRNPEVINLLLNKGADASWEDKDGKTAFDYAKDNEHIKGTDVYWRLNDAQYE